MATDVEITDPNISIYVPVAPAWTDGVCEVCHNATTTGSRGTYYERCYNCLNLPGGSVRIIVPISLVHKTESQLYASLRDYKSASPYITAAARAEHRLLLAATLQRFLRIHRPHIEQAAGVSWDTIQVVPSSRPGRTEHPLEAVVRMAVLFRDELAQLLTRTGEPIGHQQPNPAAFAPLGSVAGKKVLIIDDTFTSGARMQSVARALTSAGATIVAAVPIGRVIDTGLDEKAAFWRRQRGIPFDFDSCALDA